MKNEGLMLMRLGRMALIVDGRLGVKGLSAEEENATESLADVRLPTREPGGSERCPTVDDPIMPPRHEKRPARSQSV